MNSITQTREFWSRELSNTIARINDAQQNVENEADTFDNDGQHNNANQMRDFAQQLGKLRSNLQDALNTFTQQQEK